METASLKFVKSHEWIAPGDKTRRVGITDFAQDQLGDIVYVEFPEAGKTVAAGDEACIVESCKATSAVYAPIAGKIVAYNNALVNEPEKINQSPYEDGWLFEIEPAADAEESALMDHDAYQKILSEE
jgi:glycine cleavage system H protein